MLADIVVGLQHGDEAKGKITHQLCREGRDFYTHVLRFNGGGNAGHTIYHEGKKYVTHYIPAGVFYGIKSVIGKHSKAAYQGKIFVNSKAQKTDGYQLSKAILLDETSEFNAKPELEIYADDVKCSHGSASGSLNENSIFYLMSRGLNYQQSKELLINGFLLDVVEKITDSEIKNLVKNLIGLKE